MKMTVKKSPDRASMIFDIEVEIDDFEIAGVHLSEEERALINDAKSWFMMSDKLLALSVLVRKIEQTVRPRARIDLPVEQTVTPRAREMGGHESPPTRAIPTTPG